MTEHPPDPLRPPTDATRTASDSSQESTTHRIGQYHLLQSLGEGGMGEVWLAEQTDPVRRHVAFKVIKAGMDTKQVIARFAAERQALALMDHPAIATVFDGGSTGDGRPYFAMEYVKGEPITTYCDRHRLTMRERLDLFIQVCEGVQHAHQKGIIHRDLKPSNVLVTVQDDRPVPKIIDFGVAKAISQPLTERSLYTELGVLIGTPEYMSPEQAEMSGLDVDTRTDVYALGVMLYELMTGTLPFDRKMLREAGFDEVRRMIRAQDPPLPSARITQLGPASTESARNRHSDPARLASHLRGDLDWITMKALEKDRTRRYATANALAQDLQRSLDGEPVEAAPPSATYRLGKLARRHAAAVATLGAIGIILAASSVVSWIFYTRAAQERASAEARFAEVRSLAHFVLFDFDDLIAQGPTPARQALVRKATEYLDRLARDRGTDVELARELVDGYRKIGNLQGNPATPNLGDRAAAKKSYERALTIADATPGMPPRVSAEMRMALASLLLADGAMKEAIPVYEHAARVLETPTAIEDADRMAVLTALSRLGFCYSNVGDYAAASKTYLRMVERAGTFVAQNPTDQRFRTQLAIAELRHGEVLARQGKVEEGLPHMLRGLGIAQKMLAEAPDSPAGQRLVCIASGVIGDVLRLANRASEAADHFRRAADVSATLLESDPHNEQYQRDRAVFLGRLSEAIGVAGNQTEACTLTEQALVAVRPLVGKANPSELDLHQYAWMLISTPCVRLRDARTAVNVAKRLVESSRGQSAPYLLVLGQAYGGMGDFERAIQTIEKALTLLPDDNASDLRREAEKSMATYRAGQRWVVE